MTETKKAEVKRKESAVISPSKNEWLMFGVTFTGDLEFQGIKDNGDIFKKIHKLNSPSIDLLAYANTITNKNSNSGGGLTVKQKEVSDRYLIDENIESVYVYKQGEDDKYVIVVFEDKDDISLQIANVKREILKLSNDYYFVVTYEMFDSFDPQVLPSAAKRFVRG